MCKMGTSKWPSITSWILLSNCCFQFIREESQQIIRLLYAATDWLAVLELAVNLEAEKFYGIEGLGLFDEF
jgi:hypothetical protein